MGAAVRVAYTEWRSGGEPLNPGDEWTSYSDEYVHVEFHYLSPNVEGWGVREVEHVIGDIGEAMAYLVVTRYSTGDTFSWSNGHWVPSAVCADLDTANALVKTIREAHKHNKYIAEYQGQTIHMHGVGFFEALESVDVLPLIILTVAEDRRMI